MKALYEYISWTTVVCKKIKGIVDMIDDMSTAMLAY